MSRHFESFGFPLVVDQQIVPDDDTTLFVCSGMQRVKNKFVNPDNTKHGSLQSCIRTNDLELVGDGTHLTYFEMLGNFSFGSNDYELSVELWHSLMLNLGIKVDSVHVHPNSNHHELWRKRGHTIVDDPDCQWSDGSIGGFCCEMYSRGVEIGNLVNTLGHSTDVGFGWERLHMIMEGVERVDQTSLFGHYHPIVSDHVRSLEVMWRNGIIPGCKGRNFVCQRLLRRIIPLLDGTEKFVFDEWLGEQKRKRDVTLLRAQKMWRRHKDKPPQWWFETTGLIKEELDFIKNF